MGEISGSVGVHGGENKTDPVSVTAAVGGTGPATPLDVSVGIKDAAFAIGGILNQPLTIDLGPVDLVVTGDSTLPVTINAGLSLKGAETEPVTVGVIGNKDKPVTVNATVNATIDAGLDNIGFTVKGDPNNPVTVDLGLDDVRVCLSLGITEIPSVQVNMPTRSCVGLSVLGIPIFNLSFEGQWGLTTQDNPPRIFPRPAHEEGCAEDRNMPGVTVSLDPEL